MITQYLKAIASAGFHIDVTMSARRGTRDADAGFKKSVQIIRAVKHAKKKIILIGNGGSASIASHFAVDFWKNARIRALAFNDASLLTCIGNDCGYEHVFGAPMTAFADRGDAVIAISSSGRSPNILNGVRAAKKRGCSVITLSGFAKTNPLRKAGAVNFYVPSPSYGIVETLHAALCHAILDHFVT